MKATQFRQGDVLLHKISAIPDGVEEIPGPIVLAYGEVTGHAHAIKLPAEERRKVVYWEANAERYLQILETVNLVHEEHAPIVLEKGNYRQGFQVEDYGQEVRRVKD